MKTLAALLMAAGCAAAAAQTTCPAPAASTAGAQVMRDGAVQAQWFAVPGPIVVGKPFALDIHVCPAGAELTRVDATMPEHRHGMNYRPSLKPLGDGRWRVEGLLWHMSGRWELRLDLKHDGRDVRLAQSVTLK